MPPAPDPVQLGVSLALEAHRRHLLDDRALDAILAYYDHEGARDPAPVDEVLARIGGVPPAALSELLHGPRPTASDVQGQRFGERLTLLEPIGSGGMGSVYRGYDRVLKRVVAVKRLRTDHLDGPGLARVLSRFEREAHAMARVRHPACVQIFDAGVTKDGEPYLVMEFVAGKSLRGLLEERPRTPPRQVAEWGAAIADALQACHDVGLIHRDVKPANVLLDAQGKPHLTDFGVALDDRAHTKLTADQAMVGTLTYMPPEQALGEPIDARSDVYALGATLFEALTGRAPFESPATLVLLRMVLDAEAPTVRSLRPDCPQDLETIVAKCLGKSAADRYATAQALALDLRRFLADEPVLATRLSPAARLGRRLWRHRRLLGASLAALALAAAGLVATRVHARAERRAAADALLARAESTAAVASDLEAAEVAVLPLVATAEPDQADRARETLRLLRGRRRLVEAEAAIERWRAATARAREADREATALKARVDPQQPYRDSPDKQRVTALNEDREAAEADAAVALLDAERALALAGSDLEGSATPALRARLLIERARAIERDEVDRAERLFREAEALDRASGGAWAKELAPPIVEVRTPTPGAECTLSAYEPDRTRGRQLPRGLSRGSAPGTLTGAGANEYVVEVTAPGYLPCRELMLLTRGERRVFEVTLFSRESLGPLADMVVHIPAGEARWGERLEVRGRVERDYLMLRTEVMVDQWYSFMLVAVRDDSYVPAIPRDDHGRLAQLTIEQRALWPTTRVSWNQLREFLGWLQWELDLASLAFDASLPSEAEWHRAVRGEFGWFFPWGNEPEASFCGTRDGRSHSQLTLPSELRRFVDRRALSLSSDDVSGFGVEALGGGVSELMQTASDGFSEGGYVGGRSSFTMSINGLAMRESVPDWTRGKLQDFVGFRWVLRGRESGAESAAALERYLSALAIAEANRPGFATSQATRALVANPAIARGWRVRSDLRTRAGDAWGALWDRAVAATRR